MALENQGVRPVTAAALKEPKDDEQKKEAAKYVAFDEVPHDF